MELLYNQEKNHNNHLRLTNSTSSHKPSSNIPNVYNDNDINLYETVESLASKPHMRQEEEIRNERATKREKRKKNSKKEVI